LSSCLRKTSPVKHYEAAGSSIDQIMIADGCAGERYFMAVCEQVVLSEIRAISDRSELKNFLEQSWAMWQPLLWCASKMRVFF